MTIFNLSTILDIMADYVPPDSNSSSLWLDAGIDSPYTFNASTFIEVGHLKEPTVGLPGHRNQVEDLNATHLVLANGTRTKVAQVMYFNRQLRVQPVMVLLSFYVCPALVALGLASNILAYLVLTRTRLRRVPSVPYLAAMAVVDSGALVTEFIQHGLKLHDIFIINWPGVCQYTVYFNFIFTFLCVWYPVAFCVEKFIGVYFPLRRISLCTTFRAKVVIVCMLVMTSTCYYYAIYMTGPIGQQNVVCAVWEVFRKDFYYLMVLDIFFVIILPNATLLVLVVLICGRGCEYYRISSAVEVSGKSGSNRNSSLRAPVRVTNVIFPLVVVIWVIKLPLGFIRAYGGIFHQGLRVSITLIELQSYFIFLARFDWVVKFYVYLVFSPCFRHWTKSFLCGVRAKLQNKYCRDSSSEEEELRGVMLPDRIRLYERGVKENTRECLMVSDV